MQCEHQTFLWRIRRLAPGGVDDLLQMPGARRHRRRIPDGAQQRRFEIGDDPRNARVGVDDLHECIAGRQHAALANRLDTHGHMAAMRVQHMIPAGAIERLAMREQHLFRLVYVGARDRLRQHILQIDLQAEEQALRKGAAARFDIARDEFRPGRILQKMAGLVAVGVENSADASHVWNLLQLETGARTPRTPK